MRVSFAAMQIDLEPNRHSHLYELKPMSKWWLLPIVAFGALCLSALGWTNVQAWACLFAGAMFMLALLLIFPRYFLSRRD